MLSLILNYAQYLQNVAFSFEKGLTGQHQSFSGFHHLIKNPAKYLIFTHWERIPPPSLNAIWKTLQYHIKFTVQGHDKIILCLENLC